MFKSDKKTIFLDIDGVLSTEKEFNRSRRKFHKKYDEAEKLHIPYPFNDGCVNIFNFILEETDSQIVLSSDWRLHWNLDELDLIFKFNKVNRSPVSITGIHPISLGNLTLNRINEIELFKKLHNINHYVIIDDLPMDIYNTDRFVKTIDLEGLKQIGIKEKILKFLKDE
jgi:hypothetical protein